MSPGGAAERPGAPATVATGAPLVFADLAWDADRSEVARALVARDFSHAAGGPREAVAWRGNVFGRRAQLTADVDREGRLIAITLRFDADTNGSAIQRYTAVADAMRRRHGPWTIQVAPGRPVDEERLGRFAVTRRFGPVTAATLWTDASGAAAAVQLDGQGMLWLRYESPRWEAATREKEDATR